MADEKEIAIPPGVLDDPERREMLRAWVAHEGLHCTLNMGHWDEREATGWGVLLSDVARHVANALHESSGVDVNDVLEHIKDVFNDELDEPAPPSSGGFIQIQ